MQVLLPAARKPSSSCTLRIETLADPDGDGDDLDGEADGEAEPVEAETLGDECVDAADGDLVAESESDSESELERDAEVTESESWLDGDAERELAGAARAWPAAVALSGWGCWRYDGGRPPSRGRRHSVSP